MRHLCLRRCRPFRGACRNLSSLTSYNDASKPVPADPPVEDQITAINPRWLTDIKSRIGKCLTFGMNSALVSEAGKILQEVATDWKNLTVGCEGFLTQREHAGLHSYPLVWGYHDAMGHVNNVQYVRFAESGRTNWARNYGKYFDVAHQKEWNELLTNNNVGLILKSITVDFKFPMTWPDRISVYHKLRSRPDSTTQSMLLDVMILSEMKQRPAARCLEDVVVYDYRNSKKSSLPAFMLEQFKKTYDLQEAARKENMAKVRKIEDSVRSLEMSSWDRPDAQEDFGHAHS